MSNEQPGGPPRMNGSLRTPSEAAARSAHTVHVPQISTRFIPTRQPVLGVRTAPGLPLPVLLDNALGERGEVHCVVTPVGRDGRLADRSVLTAMGWTASRTVAMAVEPGPIVVVRPGEAIHIGVRRQLRVPLPIRRRCGISTGDRLLVAADRSRGELIVIPMPVVADMISVIRGRRDAQTPR